MIIDLEQAPKQDNGSPIMIGRRTGFLTMKRIGRDRMRNASEIYIKVPDSIYAISSPFLMGLLNDALTVNPELADYVTITPGFQATLSDAIRSIRMHAEHTDSVRRRRRIIGKRAMIIGAIILLSGPAGVLLGDCVYSVATSVAGIPFTWSFLAGSASAVMIWITAAITGAGIIKRGIK